MVYMFYMFIAAHVSDALGVKSMILKDKIRKGKACLKPLDKAIDMVLEGGGTNPELEIKSVF